MFGAELLKLRRNRPLMAFSFLLSVVVVCLFFGYNAIEHASDPSKYGPAGGAHGFDRLVETLGLWFGALVAALIGSEAGTADLSSGVFRDLVATGRSRFALFARALRAFSRARPRLPGFPVCRATRAVRLQARTARPRAPRRVGPRSPRQMNQVPESHRDLLDADVGVLTTIDSRGLPASSAVWFLHDDGEVRLSLNSSRLKTRNLQERPECSLFVLDRENPYRYLEIRGRARLEPDPDYAFADQVGAKYGGADLRAHDGEGQSRFKVTVEPVKVWAVDMRG